MDRDRRPGGRRAADADQRGGVRTHPVVDERREGRRSAKAGGITPGFSGDRTRMLDSIHDALYAAKIISYARGFLQMRTAANGMAGRSNSVKLHLLWRAGCIIRSGFLDDIKRLRPTSRPAEPVVRRFLRRQPCAMRQPAGGMQ